MADMKRKRATSGPICRLKKVVVSGEIDWVSSLNTGVV